VDQYDLEILTHDWSRYDANSAIVKTSRLSPEQINAFVAEYDREINEVWEKQVQGYRENTNTPYENLQVEGYFKTQFVYRLLSEDLIEALGSFRLNGRKRGDAVEALCQRLEKVTEADPALIRKTFQTFIDRGYIKSRQDNENLIWYWTHNNSVNS
jgi:hypothetical protein